VLPPFGSTPLRSPLLRPMTSTPHTIRNYFTILTRSFCIPSTSLYMSFRVAQDYNKVASRDKTSSTVSSTRPDDPTAMMRHHNRSLLLLAVVSVLVSRVINYIVVDLVFLS
jgi:hypothetical protein